MKLYHLFFILMGALMLASCNKFLDEDPDGAIPINNSFADENDLRINGVAALYLNVGGYKDSEGLQHVHHRRGRRAHARHRLVRRRLLAGALHP